MKQSSIGDQGGWPGKNTAALTLFALMMALIVSQLDRMIINLLVEPIKKEFSLNDMQFGMLQGIAFGLFYTFMALPIGMLADRFERRLIVGVGIGVFSIFSVLTGLSRNFFQLFLCRVGVGVGEASVVPAGFSIISDTFPPEKLGRAMSLFTMSSFIGTAVAYSFGGAMIGWLDKVHAATPEALFGMAPWQAAFVVAAIPGLILTPCFLLMREPTRRGVVSRSTARLPWRELGKELKARRRFLVLVFGGMSMVSTVGYATTIWTPAVFIRVFGWNVADIGIWLGVIILVTGTTGSFIAGWLMDWLSARGVRDAALKIAAISFLICGIFGAMAPLAPNATISLLLFCPVFLLKAMPFACIPVTLQLVLPNHLRAQVSAIYITVINLVGMMLGPIFIGFLTDVIFTSPTDVRFSLSWVAGFAGPIMAVLIWTARKPFNRLLGLNDNLA